jgi:hypothetical protein
MSRGSSSALKIKMATMMAAEPPSKTIKRRNII